MLDHRFKPGWCYKALFNRWENDELNQLGAYPTVAAIRRYVNSHANCLIDGKFHLTLGVDGSGVVGHVSKADDSSFGGVLAYQLLDACNKTLRLGAVGQVGRGRSASVMDLRQPRNRFVAGDQMLWPGVIPLANHYQYARFNGIKEWISGGPGGLHAALSEHVFHKAKPTDEDLRSAVRCYDLFKVYSVCNFEGRLSFRTDVKCVYARPIPPWPELAIPWPSNVPQGSAGPSVIFGSGASTTLQGHLSPKGKVAFNSAVYGTETPTDQQLGAAIDTATLYEVYIKLPEEDKFFVREDLVPISPPPYVGIVSGLKMIGTLDPLPAEDPLPDPPVDPSPGEPGKSPGPGQPKPDPSPPPYHFPLPEAPADSAPPGRGPLVVPVNDVPSGVVLPGPFGGSVGKQGWCYLDLLTVATRPFAAFVLGYNPVFASICDFVGSGGADWCDGQFILSQTATEDINGELENIQAHVEPCEVGLTVEGILDLLLPNARLGMATAELDALMSLQTEAQATDAASVFDVRPKVTGTSMTFGVYAKLNAEAPSFTWNLLGTPALALMFGIYESVRLESADFIATLSVGVDTSLWIAATENTVTLSGTDQWLAAPLNSTICGASTGVVRGKFSLPRNHQFGKEIRAATVGNHGPSFHFNHQGAAGSSSRITGTVTVTVSGQAVIGHVNIGPVARGKSQMQTVSDTVGRFSATLGYVARPKAPTLDPEDCYLEDDGEDGGRHLPVGSGGSPSANTASKRG